MLQEDHPTHLRMNPFSDNVFRHYKLTRLQAAPGFICTCQDYFVPLNDDCHHGTFLLSVGYHWVVATLWIA